MRDDWIETTIGEVVQQVRRPVKVEEGVEYPLLGVRWYGEGPFLREIGVGGTIKATKLFAVESGDFIYNRLFAWKGSFGVIGTDLEGSYVSGEFPLFVTDPERSMPQFLNHVMCTSSTWTQIERESTGSTATSRNRWKEERFLDWPILLPPLEQQRRIVDLIGAVDGAHDAAVRIAAANRGLNRSLVSEWVSLWSGPTASLSDLARMGSGPSWKAAEETTEPGEGRVRVLGITNTPPSGAMNVIDRKYVSGLPPSTSTLTESSLVMIRTNGNRSRIGNVYRVVQDALGCAFSAFQIGLHFDTPADAAFAFWMLSAHEVQTRISESASGTTGLGNVAVRWLRELELPWPPSAVDRERAVDLFDSSDAASARSEDEVAMLEATRNALVADLLSGAHEIPASYDELLERVS